VDERRLSDPVSGQRKKRYSLVKQEGVREMGGEGVRRGMFEWGIPGHGNTREFIRISG